MLVCPKQTQVRCQKTTSSNRLFAILGRNVLSMLKPEGAERGVMLCEESATKLVSSFLPLDLQANFVVTSALIGVDEGASELICNDGTRCNSIYGTVINQKDKHVDCRRGVRMRLPNLPIGIFPDWAHITSENFFTNKGAYVLDNASLIYLEYGASILTNNRPLRDFKLDGPENQL